MRTGVQKRGGQKHWSDAKAARLANYRLAWSDLVSARVERDFIAQVRSPGVALPRRPLRKIVCVVLFERLPREHVTVLQKQQYSLGQHDCVRALCLRVRDEQGGWGLWWL